MGERQMGMVEKVARTILIATDCGFHHSERGRCFCDDERFSGDSAFRETCNCKNVARAVIEAMREPTGEMIVSGLDGLVCKIGEQNDQTPILSDAERAKAQRYIRIGRRMQDGFGVKACWQGAIDAALSETPTPAKEP